MVGEELGVLPAMDSIFAVYALAGLVGSLNVNQTNRDKFDIIVYDGVSTDETLRVIGAASKARLVEFLTSPTQLSLIFLSVLNNITVLRLYLKYLRNLAEKTDLGRLAGPSLVSLVDEALSLSGSKYNLNRKTSAEIWDSLETMLMQGSSAFYEPSRFGCYLVMDPNIPTSVNAALRYWGCTLQAGAQVSGAIGISSPRFNEESLEGVKKNFLPLPFAFIPHLSIGYPPEWNSVMLNTVGHDARTLFSLPASHSNSMAPPVKFDAAEKSVTLFMPGFDKSEIKLYQYRGGSELLVEAGDQRRVICLPTKIQGKVGGAKFFDRSLVITMR